MKRIIIILIILCTAYTSNAQNLKESEVPAAVKNAFASMYPTATSVKWEMENNNYEGEFKENGTETSAIFSAGGTYLQTEVEIPVKFLPEAVGQYVSKNLAGEKIKEATKITEAAGTITYEAEVGGIDYLFDSNGGFLKKTSDSPDDKDDDDSKK